MALTNHGNVDGNIKFQQSCEKEGIIPIHGFEGYLVDNMLEKEKKETRYHITLLAENETGWENILQLLTESWMEGFNRRPRFDLDALLRHSEGLIVLSACSSSFLTHTNGEKILLDLKQNIPEGNLWLEVMPHIFQPQLEVNNLCLNYSKKYNIPMLATNDCHYVREEDHKLQEVLLAIQSQAKWKDPNRWKFSFKGLHAKTAEEMFEEFKKQGQFSGREVIKYLTNTMLVAEKCNFKIPKREVKLPQVPGFEGKEDSETITEICKKGFEKKIAGKVKGIRVYEERMKEELNTIINLGFSRYFVIVWELVNWCKNNDIMVGPGRGSVGGSLVAYLMDITSVDPIKYGLVFARFISPARIDLPDIDMDFEDAKRHLIRKHLEDIYGKDCVSSVSTFSTMKGRGALRDVSRVFDIPIVDVNAASKSIVQRSGGDFRCLEENTEVYTTEGTKKISELKIGDRLSRVFGKRIESGEVCGLWDNGDTEVFELELESGKKIICSDKHRFWTKKGWKKLSELKEDDEILTADKEEIYHSCLNCGAIIWGKKKQFCSLSCATTYRNISSSPMKNLGTIRFKKRDLDCRSCLEKIKENIT
jgi:DNA polymerase-3 subunit alpha